MMQTLIAVFAAVLLDFLLGEPRRWHPLVGFGKLAEVVEQHLNSLSPFGERGKEPTAQTRFSGFAAVIILLLPITICTYLIANTLPHAFVFETLVLYFALGARSLTEHADQVHRALSLGKTEEARRFTGYLVSRDTSDMSERDMSRATIESTLENGCDAVFAPLFWFLIGGAPAAVFYRLANTLDAMWGYKTKRYLHFGWAAARLDDVLNYIPARLTALTYALTGQFSTALSCWRAQAISWKSPNAGPVMSSGAGALALQLGGPAHYHGELQDRPLLGKGHLPSGVDIARGNRLLQRGIALWLVLLALVMGGLFLA